MKGKTSAIATEDQHGNLNIKVTCGCGKPIIKADKYGMECEDECAKKAFLKLPLVTRLGIHLLEKATNG